MDESSMFHSDLALEYVRCVDGRQQSFRVGLRSKVQDKWEFGSGGSGGSLGRSLMGMRRGWCGGQCHGR